MTSFKTAFIMAIATTIPTLLKLPVRILKKVVPRAIPTAVMARIGNHLMEDQQLIQRLDEIEGSKICLRISDIDLQLFFQVRGSRLYPGRDKTWDMRISGSLNHLLALATRREDPDTLFFNRSLVLEGKTEIGLYVKNLLDALDLSRVLDLDQQLQVLTGQPPPQFVSRLSARVSNLIHCVLNR